MEPSFKLEMVSQWGKLVERVDLTVQSFPERLVDSTIEFSSRLQARSTMAGAYNKKYNAKLSQRCFAGLLRDRETICDASRDELFIGQNPVTDDGYCGRYELPLRVKGSEMNSIASCRFLSPLNN